MFRWCGPEKGSKTSLRALSVPVNDSGYRKPSHNSQCVWLKAVAWINALFYYNILYIFPGALSADLFESVTKTNSEWVLFVKAAVKAISQIPVTSTWLSNIEKSSYVEMSVQEYSYTNCPVDDLQCLPVLLVCQKDQEMDQKWKAIKDIYFRHTHSSISKETIFTIETA